MSKATDKIISVASDVTKNANVKIAAAAVVTAAVVVATGIVIKKIESDNA